MMGLSYKSLFNRLLSKDKHRLLQPVMVMGDLHGYAFLCPGCGSRHFLPTNVNDAEGRRWAFNKDMEHPSFSPAFRFIMEHEDRRSDVCAGWVSRGVLDFTDDCTHVMRGKIVPMSPLD